MVGDFLSINQVPLISQLLLAGAGLGISNLTITSRLLANIINNNWIYNNISLGTKESTVNSYDIFFDEGYKIRKIGKEIYNIVFNKNYANEILQGVSTTTSVENVKSYLGTQHLRIILTIL